MLESYFGITITTLYDEMTVVLTTKSFHLTGYSA